MKKSDFLHSIRFKITGITILFVATTSIIFACSSFVVFYQYARTSVLNAVSYNLQIASQSVEKDLDEWYSIVKYQSIESKLISYLSTDNPVKFSSISIYNNLLKATNATSSSKYLQRLVVTNYKDAIFNVSHTGSTSVPLTQYNVEEFPHIKEQAESYYKYVVNDPFDANINEKFLLLKSQIKRPHQADIIGTIYLTLSTDIVTERLRFYDELSQENIYVIIGGKSYLVDGNYLIEKDIDIKTKNKSSTNDEIDNVYDVVMNDGTSNILIEKNMENFDISFVQIVPNDKIFAEQNILIYLIIIIVALTICLGGFLYFYLNKLIVKPVQNLNKRIEFISNGEFDKGPKVASNTELGNVGRYIDKLSLDVQNLISQHVNNEKEKQQLEYKVLQNQINPHFIYNTLNSIKWMATLQGVSNISEMTTSFARLLKSVSKGNESLITLREELALLNDYFVIQQYRYGGNIKIDVAEISDEKLVNCLIPRFSLQPIVENAIFHGIEPKGGIGSVLLYIKKTENDIVEIAVEDDGIGIENQKISEILSGKTKQADKFDHIGIYNVSKRIKFAFGDEYGISIVSEKGKYTKVILEMPFKQ